MLPLKLKFKIKMKSMIKNGFRRLNKPMKGPVLIPDLMREVHVFYDQRGIPHIEATNEHDLYMAQGYVTAHDRLWQMDMMRRLVAGRLAEVLGESQLQNDQLYRTLQLKQAAERSFDAYNTELQEYMTSYALGVTRWIERAIQDKRLPLEFKLLKYIPEAWTPIDTLYILKLMSYDMSENWRGEAYRYQLQKELGYDLAIDLFPCYPEDGYITLNHDRSSVSAKSQLHSSSEHTIDLKQLINLYDKAPDESAGSNAWVLSGKHTQSGKPILANDPHINYSNPALWYQSHLVVANNSINTLNVIGVSIPGIPGIILGHNDHIAWGVTNTKIDTQDLFIERRDSKNPSHYVYKDSTYRFKVFPEQVKVKGKPDFHFEVLATHHGPILSNLPYSTNVAADPDILLSLAWTGHLATTELDAIFKINKAQNWSEFREALQTYQSPVLSFVFASEQDIGMKVAGLVPIRKNHDGLTPVSGWEDTFEHVDMIPFDELPETLNPEQGMIISANNKIISDEYPFFLSHTWAPTYRASRLYDVLNNSSSFNVHDMMNLQLDYFNQQAQLLLPLFIPLFCNEKLTDNENTALSILKSWNFVDDAHQAAPLIYYFWIHAIGEIVFKPLIEKNLFEKMFDKINVLDQMLIKASQGTENKWIAQAGGLAAVVISSFKHAVQTCIVAHGTDIDSWKWGGYHLLGPAHPIGESMKWLGFFMNVDEQPVGGSNISVGAMVPNKDGKVYWAASWRFVIDMNDTSNEAYDILTPGQSGNFHSLHYDDQAQNHDTRPLFKQVFKRTEYQAGKLLLLKPTL